MKNNVLSVKIQSLVQNRKFILFIKLLPFLIFTILSLTNLHLPGLYMDSVNPDYLATFIGNSEKVPAWIYNDNIIMPDYKYPILNSLYGGATTAYIGLFFLKVFGYSVFSIRLLHNIYGLIVLFFFGKFLKSIFGHERISFWGCLLLAINPTFVYLWRTQYYLQMFALITFIPGLSIIINELSSYIEKYPEQKESSPQKLFLGMLLIGFSAFGYFIYVLYAAVIFLFIVFVFLKRRQLKLIFTAVLGFIVGYAPYIYAHISMVLNYGFEGYKRNLLSLGSTYGITSGYKITATEKLLHVFEIIYELPTGMFIENVFFGDNKSILANVIINIVTVILAVFAIVLQFIMKNKLKYKVKLAIRILFSLLLSHCIIGFLIGMSLSYQHYIMLLFVLLGLVLGLFYIVFSSNLILKHSVKIVSIIFVCFSILISYNMDRHINQRLESLGGVGDYSEVINKLGIYLDEKDDESIVVFPQWGYWMGVAMITGGEREIVLSATPEELANKLNNSEINKSVLIVFTANDEMMEKYRDTLEKTTKYCFEKEVEIKAKNPLDHIIIQYYY